MNTDLAHQSITANASTPHQTKDRPALRNSNQSPQIKLLNVTQSGHIHARGFTYNSPSHVRCGNFDHSNKLSSNLRLEGFDWGVHYFDGANVKLRVGRSTEESMTAMTKYTKKATVIYGLTLLPTVSIMWAVCNVRRRHCSIWTRERAISSRILPMCYCNYVWLVQNAESDSLLLLLQEIPLNFSCTLFLTQHPSYQPKFLKILPALYARLHLHSSRRIVLPFRSSVLPKAFLFETEWSQRKHTNALTYAQENA